MFVRDVLVTPGLLLFSSGVGLVEIGGGTLMRGNDEHTSERTDNVRVTLMGGFGAELRGSSIMLPLDAQRLVAYLAIEGQPRSRAYVAGRLWSEGSQERAYGNLRSALWRARKEVPSLISADAQSVSLGPTVGVDVQDIDELAQRLQRGDSAAPDSALDHRTLNQELLAGWYDEWTLVERERVRQVCLHALESIALQLLTSHRYAAALEAALAAVSLEPLRESAHRAVIQIHLTEGNHCEAIRHYETFSSLLESELGLKPSPIIEHQMSGLLLGV